MDSVEKYGKTVEDAIAEALASLKATRDQVEITVLESGSKGLFGFGSKPAKILAQVKFDPIRVAERFIREIADAMQMQIQLETEMKERALSVVLTGADAYRLIGKHGQTLDALQYLVSLVVNKGSAPYVNVMLDCENYRQRRKEILENLANNLAKKAKATRRNVVLEPMSAYERRIIHAALQNDRYVTTYSEGEEPNRNVVISPKPQKSYQKQS